MKNFLSCLLLCLTTASAVCAAEGIFEVKNPTPGAFQIYYNQALLIDSITAQVSNGSAGENRQYSVQQLPDGTTVYNVWSEVKDYNFRLEIALHAGGKLVEITFMTEVGAFASTLDSNKLVTLTMPYERFANGSYSGYVGRATGKTFRSGKFSELKERTMMCNSDWRYMAMDDGQGNKLVFDFNPIGPGDFISIYPFGALKGLWHCRRDSDKLRFFGGSRLLEHGGFTGTKLCIRAGDMNNYKREHALENFFYDQSFAPERLYSFGAELKGGQYTAADVQNYSAQSQFGWVKNSTLKKEKGQYPGAYYSYVAGQDGVFKVSGLAPGVYIVSVGIGNMQNRSAEFDLYCNGELISGKITPGKQQGMTLCKAVWIENGSAEFTFKGNFMVSTLGLQRLISSAEDFSFRRGPWVSNGYEPGNLFRNIDYARPVSFPCDVQKFFLPEPGRESANVRKNTPDKVLTVKADDPQLRWRYSAVIGNMLSNSSTLGELDDPEALGKYFEQQRQRRANTLLLSGLHSRHTYFNHIERGQQSIIKLAQEAHKHDMKLIDHHDVTLLWNLDGGFRILAERLPEVTRNIHNQLPGYQLCIMNPDFRKRYTAYILELVKGGVDGFMLDEAHFFPDCCSCQYCREQFYKDTNWHIPVNELDAFFGKNPTELKLIWQKWRKQKVGDWWVEMRQAINTVNPSVSLLVYSTHYGFTDRWAPLRLGADLFEDARGADFIGTEIMSRNILRSSRTIPGYRRAKNLMRTAYGYPIWGLIQQQPDWDGAYFGWAMVNMHGQAVWVSHPSKESGSKAFLDFTQENMRSDLAVPESKIALLFSSPSRDFAPVGALLGELFGTAQTLDMMHIPYSIIGQMSLKPEVLSAYKVLIVGGCSCLSDAEVAAVKEFARNGGTVLITGNSGVYDENGRQRQVWAFEDIFKQAPSATAASVRRFALPGMERVNVSAPLRIFPLAKRREHLLSQDYGKGKVYYLNILLGSALYAAEGTPGRMWTFQPDPVVDQVYRQLLNKLTANAQCWQIKAPEMVLTSLYRQQDQMVVHLLNATACSNTPGKPMLAALPDPAFPELAEDITFELPGPWRSAYAVSPDFAGRKAAAVEFDRSWNVSRITVKKELLKVYTIIFVQP